MEFPAFFTLVVMILAAALFISERVRPDLVALIVLVFLGIGGIVTPQEAFAGFSGSAVITILGISILSEALRQTGVTRWLGTHMHRLGARTEKHLILTTLLVSAGLSLLMNNIAVVGVLLPAVLGLARRSHTSPSRLMMPLAYGTALGGMATLLTTANLIVSNALKDAGYAPFGLLDFFPVGAPLVVLGAVYMVTLGIRLMPHYTHEDDTLPQQLHEKLSQLYGLTRRLYEIEVLPTCPLAGQTLREARWLQRTGLRILTVRPQGRINLPPFPGMRVHPGDVLVVQGILQMEQMDALGLRFLRALPDLQPIAESGLALAEIIVSPHGGLIGRTLQEVHFNETYQLQVLGIWREGAPLLDDLGSVRIREGDTLLVQGAAERLHLLRHNSDWIVLEEDPDAPLKPERFGLSLGITALALGTAAFNLLPVSLAVFGGAVLLLLTGCLDMQEAYHAVEWKAIFLIAGMWPLSTAMRTSGLVNDLLQPLMGGMGQLPVWMVALILIVLAFIFTQIMSGQVAALVLAPVAITVASHLHLDARALGMAVALGCSLSFPTPFGHPVNVLVMTPGGYTFRDYFRVGMPLTLLAIVFILTGLHLFWGI
ncbi:MULTISPECIES: SLC13 family permease [Anaerolinea]|uniref:SLC13 family permease n=1 Tax=Anaerolinea TaxID=233189 RepID=UPI00261674F5|nr:SLC13 family permease [Anaerolinea thermophila]